MDTMEIIAQGIGIVAMMMNIISYQQKTPKGIIFFQLCGGVLFSTSFIMLGAYVGGLLNFVGIFRCLIYLNKEKLNATHPLWVICLALAFISVYVLTFTAFGKEPEPLILFIEALPVLSMILSMVAYCMKSAKTVRILSFIGSPLWLVYNLFAGNIGAICSEIFCEVSIIVGILRHDIKRGKKGNEPEPESSNEPAALAEEN